MEKRRQTKKSNKDKNVVNLKKRKVSESDTSSADFSDSDSAHSEDMSFTSSKHSKHMHRSESSLKAKDRLRQEDSDESDGEDAPNESSVARSLSHHKSTMATSNFKQKGKRSANEYGHQNIVQTDISKSKSPVKRKAESSERRMVEKDEQDEDESDPDSPDNDDDEEEEESENEEEQAESEEDEYAAIKRELADMPLEDVMKLKEKVGLKVFSKIMHGDKFNDKPKQKVFKRANKNRPMEVSSKRRVGIVRNFTIPKEKVKRDPRFDDLSGEYSEQHFSRNFSFLSDVKDREKQIIEKKITKTKNEEKKQQLQELLNRMKQQEHMEKSKKKKQELESTWKQKEKALIKEGKTPYFLKKADKKKLELAEKYRELQKSGKMDQYLSKKRKKNAQKERKKLPNQHLKFN